ncbi:MAG: hypothetical protein IPI34_11480 [bacterium]|nr:hypothetical protein [bacterium]
MHERRPTILAFLAALALHVLLLIVTWNLDLFRPLSEKEVAAVREQTVEVVLESEPAVPALPAVTLPTAYTSVPERQQAEAPPAVPDFLALRDSRAADRIAGGTETSSPRAERTGEFPQVAILPGAGEASPPTRASWRRPRAAAAGPTATAMPRASRCRGGAICRRRPTAPRPVAASPTARSSPAGGRASGPRRRISSRCP